jgi:hypothetical protein
MTNVRAILLSLAGAAMYALVLPAAAQQGTDPINPPPTRKAWTDLAKLPDWSGVWTPDIRDQGAQVNGNPPPWTPEAAKQIDALFAQEKAGHPKLVFSGCLPESMPSWMLISHNAMEILFTPGRVTMLGESDGNRIRRIYTDGRKHPDDPDPTFHGHSIGHWEGDTLVVDTVGIRPQTFIAVTEAAGIPNDGDLHVVERIHLADAKTLHDDLEITAPKVLTGPWKTTRAYFRQRKQKYDIVEGVCEEGSFREGTDKDGNAIFVPISITAEGVPVPNSVSNSK